MPGEGLWQFANRLYAAPGVSDACLKLQDECGVDVCVLMLLLWLARRGRCVRPTQAQMILRVADEWRRDIVQPLRTMRRALKTAPTFVEAASRERLRAVIKKAELQAEQLQLEALEATFGESRICDVAVSARAAASASIESYQSASSRVFAASAIDVIVAATENVSDE